MNNQNKLLTVIGLVSIITFLGFNINKIDNQSSFDENSNPKLLENIAFKDTLHLSQRDDKCGEWGGNYESVIIYRKNKKLYADYAYQTVDCGNPYEKSTDKNTKKNMGCELLYDELEMILKAVSELTEMKLNNPYVIGHGGVVNSVSMNYPDFKIVDFPSKDWRTFNLLCARLKKKNCN